MSKIKTAAEVVAQQNKEHGIAKKPFTFLSPERKPPGFFILAFFILRLPALGHFASKFSLFLAFGPRCHAWSNQLQWKVQNRCPN